MQELEGRVAVVTGGGSGIGSGICRALATAGVRLVVADLDGERAESVAAAIRGQGGAAVAEVVDVAALDSVVRLAEATLSTFGRVDVLCNNAGVYLNGSPRELTPDDWRWVLSVNLDGVYHGCRAFLPLLLEAGGGHILNTASLGGLLPSSSAYSSSKAAVISYSEIMRADLEPDGIGVSCLCPGAVRTDLASCDRLRPADLGDAGNSSAVLAPMIEGGMSPDEVGAIAVRGIQRNDAFIFPDSSARSEVEARFGRILDAMRPVGG
ncbi:MAG: SDR family NAD(P)-dependent oxidoreductase [Deltaproteobacteria bacterium]|jgi:NAD(P)-dependent dehydrogenase (short-subunit alcohol dehydrogenase family)|nr:SDR family NAD(P)-dependent oxidoreductase [Deltaproteobacteria bacterium]